MARPKLPPELKRPEVKIYPTPALLAWVDALVGPGKRFYNRTHAFEYAVTHLMRAEAEESNRAVAASRGSARVSGSDAAVQQMLDANPQRECPWCHDMITIVWGAGGVLKSTPHARPACPGMGREREILLGPDLEPARVGPGGGSPQAKPKSDKQAAARESLYKPHDAPKPKRAEREPPRPLDEHKAKR